MCWIGWQVYRYCFTRAPHYICVNIRGFLEMHVLGNLQSIYFVLYYRYCVTAFSDKENQRGEAGVGGKGQVLAEGLMGPRWAGLLLRHLQRSQPLPSILFGFKQSSLLTKAISSFRPSSPISILITIKETTPFHS